MAGLSLQNLQKTYGKVEVIKGVNLEIEHGGAAARAQQAAAIVGDDPHRHRLEQRPHPALGEEPAHEGAVGELRDDVRRDAAAEVDAGFYGLAAPLFDGDGRVVGSISCVRPLEEHDERLDEEHGQQIMTLADNLTQLAAALSHRPPQLD